MSVADTASSPDSVAAAHGQDQRDIEHPPLTGASLVLGTLALSLATFMNILDTSIANVSIHAISGDMAVSPAQGTWVITSFAVANAISVPLTGWLTRRLGQVRLFLASMLLFVAASLLCGLAPNIEMLVLFRVLQGLVAGPMIPLSQTLLLASYPPAKAGTAMAAWVMTIMVAPVVGPLLGGWITDNVSWPWIFYINVPIGLFASMMIWAIYRERETATRRQPLDYIGLGLLVLFVGAMQIVLDTGKELDWFASDQIAVLAAVAVVSFLFFLAWELTEAHPVVNLHLFRGRNFAVGVLTQFVIFILFYGNLVLLPLWLLQYMGYTATWAGLALAPVGVLAIFMTPWVGKNIHRLDPRRLVTLALLIFSLMLWMRSDLDTQSDFVTIMIPSIVQGASTAFMIIPLQTIMYSGLSAAQLPSAAGLSNFVRLTAGALGVSLLVTLWDERAIQHHARLSESINHGNAAVREAFEVLQGRGLNAEQALAYTDRMILQQAHTMAATDIFYMSSLLTLVLVPLVWFARPVAHAAAPIDGVH